MNWFRRGDDGSFLWPGFGDNSRVLAWVLDRVADADNYVDSPIGRLPTPESLQLDGLDLSQDTLAELLHVDAESWRLELPQIEEHYASLGDRLPTELADELTELDKRLSG